MTTYLTIITTILVITQVIRITQNAITLHHQNKAIKRDLAWLKDHYVTEQDFENQREVFALLRDKLKEDGNDSL